MGVIDSLPSINGSTLSNNENQARIFANILLGINVIAALLTHIISINEAVLMPAMTWLSVSDDTNMPRAIIEAPNRKNPIYAVSISPKTGVPKRLIIKGNSNDTNNVAINTVTAAKNLPRTIFVIEIGDVNSSWSVLSFCSWDNRRMVSIGTIIIKTNVNEPKVVEKLTLSCIMFDKEKKMPAISINEPINIYAIGDKK